MSVFLVLSVFLTCCVFHYPPTVYTLHTVTSLAPNSRPSPFTVTLLFYHRSLSLFVVVIRLLSKLKILYVWCHLLIHKQLNPTVEFNTCKCIYNSLRSLFMFGHLHFDIPSIILLCLTAAAGYRTAESHGWSGGLHSEVRPERSVEPDR